ncbi:MAG: MFS transporter [Gemmataceae bacterium]
MTDNGHFSSLPTTASPKTPISASSSLLLSGRSQWWKVSFRSLRHRNYRLYFFGQLVSLTGSWMQTAALAGLAYALTGLSAWPALLVAIQIAPTFLFGAWSGFLADHVPKRRLIMATQSGFMLMSFSLAMLVWLGKVEPWQLLVVSCLHGLFQAVDLPARLAFVNDLVGREDLVNAVALNSMLFNTARAVGPAIGGVMLFYAGPQACFLSNSLSYLAVLIALYHMDVRGEPKHHAGTRAGLLSGFQYLRDHPRLAIVVLRAGTTALCCWPFLSLLPALAEKRFLLAPAQGNSWLLSATGAGALSAAFTVATFGSPERARYFIAVGITLASAALFGLSFAPNILAAVACCALIGFGIIIFLSTSQATVQLGATDLNRGRVMGIWAMTLSGSVPLGNLVVGPAADQWGVATMLRLQGLLCVTAALGLLALRHWWQARKARTPTSGGASE